MIVSFISLWTKIQIHLLDPFEIVNISPNGLAQLKDFEGKLLPTHINGYCFNAYYN